MAAKLKVTQVKSTISHIARNRATVRALGLKASAARARWPTILPPAGWSARSVSS